YGGGVWKADRSGVTDVSSAALRALAGAGAELTVTGVPVGSGTRMGIDRDRDGFPDGDEIAAGSDPGNPASFPSSVGVPPGSLRTGLSAAVPNPFRGATELELTL